MNTRTRAPLARKERPLPAKRNHCAVDYAIWVCCIVPSLPRFNCSAYLTLVCALDGDRSQQTWYQGAVDPLPTHRSEISGRISLSEKRCRIYMVLLIQVPINQGRLFHSARLTTVLKKPPFHSFYHLVRLDFKCYCHSFDPNPTTPTLTRSE